MQIVERFEVFPLTFDDRGRRTSPAELEALIARTNGASATDAIFLAHGFRNDAGEATALYTKFLETFGTHLSRPEFAGVAARRFVVAAVYWPSKPFREVYDEDAPGTRGLRNPAEAMEEARVLLDDLKRDASAAQRAKLKKAESLLPRLSGDVEAQDAFVALVLSVVGRAPLDETEGLPQIRNTPGSEVLARLSDPPAEGTRGIGDMFGGLAGGVGRFLNLTTWYVMKARSGTVGATGVAAAVRAVHRARPAIRLHLVGHSLGGRLMASCAKALGKSPKLQPDSLLLLEAAFSHFGFSPDNGRGNPGFFRDVLTSQVVKGPFVSTFSTEDTVVGKAYSIMSRLARDNTREIGDASDEFGGIGRNGPLRTPEVETARLRPPGTTYPFRSGIINNLDGSGGLIKDHSDVTNEAVTYAFASAVART